jgi:hypothetical protein
MDTKGHKKFKRKFPLSKDFAGRKVWKMKFDTLQTEAHVICQADSSA